MIVAKKKESLSPIPRRQVCTSSRKGAGGLKSGFKKGLIIRVIILITFAVGGLWLLGGHLLPQSATADTSPSSLNTQSCKTVRLITLFVSSVQEL